MQIGKKICVNFSLSEAIENLAAKVVWILKIELHSSESWTILSPKRKLQLWQLQQCVRCLIQK